MKDYFSIFLISFLFFFFSFVNGSSLRVAHASPDAPTVDILVNGEVIFQDVSFQQITSYKKNANASEYDIQVRADNKVVLNDTFSMKEDSFYTLAVVGLVNDTEKKFPLKFNFGEDDNSAPTASDEARISVFHASPGAPEVTIRADGNELFDKVNYDERTDFKSVKSGTYNITISQVGKEEVIFFKMVTLEAGFVYSAFAEGLPSKLDLVLTSNADYSFIRLKAVQASPNVSSVDIWLNNKMVIEDLEFSKVSKYELFAIDKNEDNILTITRHDEKTPLTTLPLGSVALNEYYSLILLGPNTTEKFLIQTMLLKDDNSAPEELRKAKIRFFHASPDAPNVDIHANDAILFKNVTFKTFQEATVDRNTYDLTVYIAGTSKKVLQVDSVSFESGSITSIYAEDFSSNLKAVPTVDASYDYIKLKLSHSSPNSPPVDVALYDGFQQKFIAYDLSFGELREIGFVPMQKDYQLLVYLASSLNMTILEKSLKDVEENEEYTISIIGSLDSLDLKVLEQSVDAPSTGNGKIRFFHASPNTPAVDIRANGNLLFSDVSFKDVTDYKQVEMGTYNVTVSPTGKNETLLSFVANIQNGEIATIFAQGEFPQVTISVSLESIFEYFTIRAAHATPDVDKVDVILEDELIEKKAFSDVKFGDVEKYKDIAARKDFALSISLAEKDNMIVLTIKPPVQEGQLYTAVVVGEFTNVTNGIEVVLATDDNTPPKNSEMVRVRFIHTVFNAPNVDLYLSDELFGEFTNIPYKGVSKYIEIPAFEYRLDVYPTGTTSDSPLIDDISKLKGGHVYTIFVEGGKTPGLVIAKDVEYDYFTLQATHASSDGGAVDIYLNELSTPIFTGLEFTKSNSTEIALMKEENEIVVTPANSKQPIFKKNLKVTHEEYNFVIYGLAANKTLDGLIFANDYEKTEGKTLLRFIHVSPNAPQVNVKANGDVIYEKLNYKEASKWVTLKAGEYDIELVDKNGKTVSSFNITVKNYVYTVYIAGLVPNLKPFVETTYKPPLISYVRVIHASPDKNLDKVDVKMDGMDRYYNLRFTNASNFESLPVKKGAYNFTVVPSEKKDVLFSDEVTYEEGNFTTFILGYNTSFSTLNVPENQELPTDDKVYIRFVHASPDTGAVDVKTDDKVLFSNVSYKGYTQFKQVESKTYRLSLASVGVSKSAYETELKATGPAVYTIVAEGLQNGEPKLRIVAYIDSGKAPSPDSGKKKKKLSGGAIAGIVIGSIAGVFVIVGIAYYFYKKRVTQGYERIE